MRFLDNFKIALEALFAHPTRTLLSLLGVIIGVFAVTTLISLGEMATYGIQHSLEQVAGRSVYIQPQFKPGVDPVRFDADLLKVLRVLPVQPIPYVLSSATAEDRHGRLAKLDLVGTVGDLQALDASVELARGRFFGSREADQGLPVAVLNAKAEEALFGDGEGLGRELRLSASGGARLRVVVTGVVLPAGGFFGGFESGRVTVPYKLLWEHQPWKRGRFDMIELKVEPGVDLKEVEKRARRLLELRYGKDRVSVQSVQAFQQALSGITVGLQALLGGIGALSLLVGGIGIMNIMLVSVTERTREIGLRKALGATSAQVRAQFLMEAVLLTVTGGLIGVVLAAAVLYGVVLAVPFFEAFILSPLTIALALGVSASVGLFFGVWPAAQAARLDPIEALRYE